MLTPGGDSFCKGFWLESSQGLGILHIFTFPCWDLWEMIEEERGRRKEEEEEGDGQFQISKYGA